MHRHDALSSLIRTRYGLTWLCSPRPELVLSTTGRVVGPKALSDYPNQEIHWQLDLFAKSTVSATPP